MKASKLVTAWVGRSPCIAVNTNHLPRGSATLRLHLVSDANWHVVGSKKRRKSFQPKSAEAFEVDAADAAFSSSQLIADGNDAPGVI